MLLRSIGSYLNNNLHLVLVGRRSNAFILGSYSVADQISNMPSSELLAPINRVLFPAFVNIKHDFDELKRLFLLAQGVQCLIAIPVCVGLSLVAREAVLILLGEKWSLVVPFVQVLVLVKVIEAITTNSGYVMFALGEVKRVVLLDWCQIAIFSFVVFLVFPNSGAIQIAWIRFGTVIVGLSISFWILMYTLKNIKNS